MVKGKKNKPFNALIQLGNDGAVRLSKTFFKENFPVEDGEHLAIHKVGNELGLVIHRFDPSVAVNDQIRAIAHALLEKIGEPLPAAAEDKEE